MNERRENERRWSRSLAGQIYTCGIEHNCPIGLGEQCRHARGPKTVTLTSLIVLHDVIGAIVVGSEDDDLPANGRFAARSIEMLEDGGGA